MNAATSLENETPSKDDLIICSLCLSVLQFDADLKVQRLSDKEIDLLCPEDRDEIKRTMEYVLAHREQFPQMMKWLTI